MNENEKTFDTARSEVEALFASQEPEQDSYEDTNEDMTEAEAEEVIEEAPAEAEAQAEDFAQAEGQVTEEAIQTAEQAVAVAQQKNEESSQLMALLQAERERSANLERQLSERNSAKEDEIIEEMLTPPVLDIAALAFESPEAQQAAQQKYAEEMSVYNRKMMEKELAPLKERARMADEAEAIEIMREQTASDPKFKGFAKLTPHIQSILRNNKAIANADIPLQDKILQAYAIALGLDAMEAPEPEPPKEMTTEELVEKYKGNSDFRKAIEQLRIEELKANQQVPPLASSTGASNAALNIKEKPKTFGEAAELTRQMFRV